MLNLKIATKIAVFVYSVIFWLATVTMPLGQMAMGVIIWIASIFMIYYGSRWYFKKNAPKNKLMDGLMLGIFISVVSLVMEIMAMVYGLQWGWEKYQTLLMAPTTMIGYLIFIVVPIIVAYKHK